MIEIVKKEILENLATYRFYLLSGLLALLMLVSLIVSYGDYQLRMENYNILRPAPTDAEKIILPPEPLSIFAKGLDANTGRLYQLSALGIEVQSNQQSINRLFSLFTVPDMLFVIKVLLALVALLFSFDAVCGEKEQGTLKLMLTCHARRASILLGKFAGRFALVFAPFAFLFIVAVVVVSLLPDVQTGSPYWGRLAVILVASGLYAACFLCIGMLVSAMVHRSSTSLMLGLGVWVFLVLLVPQLGTTIAQSVSDVPPADRVEMENRLTAIRSIYEAIQAAKSGERDMSRIMVQIREGNSHMFETYRPRLNRLIGLTSGLVRLSPSGALIFFMTEVANTGLSADLHLKDEIWVYINRNFRRLAHLEKEPPEHFVLREPSLGEQLSGPALADLLVLIIFPALCFAAATVIFLRYDPR
ncbi:MAG TPA: ABC transporter permease subunit [Bacteroidota bacterium]|nr:ABC transporter permease subunit [Bacteroidota bacterium]